MATRNHSRRVFHPVEHDGLTRAQTLDEHPANFGLVLFEQIAEFRVGFHLRQHDAVDCLGTFCAKRRDMLDLKYLVAQFVALALEGSDRLAFLHRLIDLRIEGTDLRSQLCGIGTGGRGGNNGRFGCQPVDDVANDFLNVDGLESSFGRRRGILWWIYGRVFTRIARRIYGRLSYVVFGHLVLQTPSMESAPLCPSKNSDALRGPVG